jgi:hypothetical protein
MYEENTLDFAPYVFFFKICIRYSVGVDSASNRDEYQEYFLGVKAAGT